MSIRNFFVTAFLLLLTAGAAATAGWLLFPSVNRDAPLAFHDIDKDELKHLHDELEYLVLAFTASAGLLALLTYWNSCAADRAQKQLDKRKYLETFHRRFLKQHEEVILAFEWPDDPQFKEYLDLCDVGLNHEKPPAQRKVTVRQLSMKEKRKLRRFDNFVDEFAFMDHAMTQDTVSVDAVMLYFDYYVKILRRAYRDNETCRPLKTWIDKYWPHCVPHLMRERVIFKRHSLARRRLATYASRLSYLVLAGIAYLLLLSGIVFVAMFIATSGSLQEFPFGKGGLSAAVVYFDAALPWVLALQIHGMNRPLFRRWVANFIPPPMVRTAYAAATALLLWLWALLWQPLPQVVWDVHDSEAREAMCEFYVVGWIAVIIGVFMTNSFNPINIKVLHDYLRSGSKTTFEFKRWASHRWARYPFMLGLQVALWAAPTMTLDRLLLACAVSLWFFAEILVRQFGHGTRRVAVGHGI